MRRFAIDNKQAALLVVISAILLTFTLACSRDPNVRKQKYLESGKRYVEKQKYREAVIQFSNALQVDPRFADAHYQLAQAYFKLGAFQSAYAELMRTVELQPNNMAAQVDLGNLLLGARQLDEADKRARLVLDKDWNNAEAHALAANIKAAKGNNDDAIQEMRKAIQLKPGQISFYTNLGALLQNTNNFGDAETAFKKAAELDPKSSQPVLMLGDLYGRQQRWNDAEQMFQKAVAVEPTSVQARVALARFYMSQQKNDRAEQVLVDAKKAMPNDGDGYRLLGDFYLGKGDTDKALAEYAALLKDHSKDLQLKKIYISTLLQKNRTDEANRLNDEILKQNPKDVEALVARGRILTIQNKTSDAIQALESAIKTVPDNAVAHYYLALAEKQAGDGRAEQELRTAVKLRPDFVEAQTALGSIALAKQDSETLYAAGDAIIAAQPNSANGYVMRAIGFIYRRDFAKGEADLMKAIQVAPQAPLAYVRLGGLRMVQGRSKEAVDMFQQALDRDPNSYDALRSLVVFDLSQKQPDRAIARVSAQVAKAANNSAFYLLLGSLQADKKDFAAAQTSLKKAIELDSKNADAFGLLGKVQVVSGTADAAVATWQNWIQQNPRDVRPYIGLGELEEYRKNWQRAQDYYQKALALQPDSPVAANNLAYSMLEHGGNVDVALSLAQTARRLDPDEPAIADTLAYAYIKKGAYRLAIDLLEDAVKKVPQGAMYQYHLGLAYQGNKDAGRAKEHLQKALQLDPKFAEADNARKALGQPKG
jgi:tetratricopeptide (TPR) repeat protein